MAFGLTVIGSVAGGLAALAAGLTLGLGPVAALIIFWLFGLAATFALAIDFASKTALGIVGDELRTPGGEGP